MPPVQETAQDPSDRELLVEAQAGSVTAFTALVDRHYNHVLYYLLGESNSSEMAHDLAQETFLDTFRSLETIPTDRSFRAWLFVTARNNLRHRRRQGRIRKLISFDRLLDRTPQEMATDDHAPGIIDGEALRTVIDELSPTLRIPLDLVGEGYTIREVADELEIDYQAARQRVSRAMRYVRDRYDDLGLWVEEQP